MGTINALCRVSLRTLWASTIKGRDVAYSQIPELIFENIEDIVQPCLMQCRPPAGQFSYEHLQKCWKQALWFRSVIFFTWSQFGNNDR